MARDVVGETEMNEGKSQADNSTTVAYTRTFANAEVQMKMQTPLAGIVRSLRILWLLKFNKGSKLEGGDTK